MSNNTEKTNRYKNKVTPSQDLDTNFDNLDTERPLNTDNFRMPMVAQSQVGFGN